MANRFVFPRQQWFNANGNPLDGGKLYFYEPGTTTPKDTYSDEELTTANTNPVVADSNGVFGDIWLDGTYKVKLTDSNDVQQFVVDNYEGPLFDAIGSGADNIPTNAYVGSYVPSITDSGTDSYQVSVGRAVSTGETFTGNIASANTTTTPTLENTSGSDGALTVTTKDGSALWAGALDGTHTFEKAASSWLVLDPNPSIQVDPIARLDTFTQGHIDGFELSNNATDSAHDIDIATGVCSMRDGAGNRKLVELTSSLTKQIDANWAEGSGVGGFPSGLTLSASTHYNVFVIGKDDGTVDAGFDTDASAANLLSDASTYSWFRRIGSVFTDGNSDIRGFRQFNDYFLYKSMEGVVDINDTSVSEGTGEVGALTVPPNVIALVTIRVNADAATRVMLLVSNGDDSDPTLDSTLQFDAQTGYTDTGASTTRTSVVQTHVSVNGSSQVRYFVELDGGGSESAGAVQVTSHGWIDDRGRNA